MSSSSAMIMSLVVEPDVDDFGNPRSNEKASTAELVASEAPAVLSWQKVIDETPTKKLAVSVLSYGGLVTVSMPYNEPGAVDIREALQEQTSEYLKMNTKFNPKYTDDLMKQASTSNDTKPPKVFFFQSETTRNSTPNKWFAIAPFWTSLHHSGKYLIAKPIDICLGLEYALANLPGYDGLEITLNRGTTATRVTMAELESAGIRMVAPPNPNIRSSPARAPASPVHVKRQAEYESEIESLKAQLDEANKKAKVPRSK